MSVDFAKQTPRDLSRMFPENPYQHDYEYEYSKARIMANLNKGMVNMRIQRGRHSLHRQAQAHSIDVSADYPKTLMTGCQVTNFDHM